MLKVKLEQDRITSDLKKKIRSLETVPQLAYGNFIQNTPKDTGNARNKTKLRGNVINAAYPYAQPLDKGRSKQSPKGMTLPMIDFLRKKIKEIFRSK
jgi:hypothetical protein